ncbi:MAG: Asp-tRNA(Asn)/Glu-tRNA(Gln) amidotransferase subunit GatB [bacterium]
MSGSQDLREDRVTAKFEAVIGFEVHVELATNTKIFCGCSTRFGSPPNTQVCPICLGMPGVLPVLNRKAIEYTIRTAIALNCQINHHTSFDRKNYYYPDLPKNYQISQNYSSLGYNGFLELPSDGGSRRIRINNVHLEEDAGKLIHPETQSADYSLVDLNRAGTPLIEIVSEPDLRSVEDAQTYMTTLKNLLQYIEVSDCKMQEGRLRFEVNISMRPVGTEKFGTKVEIKNLNSMKVALKVIEYEIKRQSRALEEGGTIVQETRLWDEEKSETRSMRSKERAHDYRYFPEPDLVEVHIDEKWLAHVRETLPELPDARKSRFISAFALSEYDASLLTASKAIADYYESAVATHNNPKGIANWILNELLRELNAREWEASDCPLTPRHLAKLVEMIDKGETSGKIAKTIFAEMIETGRQPEEIVREKGLVQVTDVGELERWVDQVLADNPGPADDYRNGKDRALGFLVGQIMKLSRGKANPQAINELFRKKLGR